MAQDGGFIDNSYSADFDSFDGPTARIKHPVVTFFHLIFRTVALLVYLLCNWFSDNFIGNFVAITLLLSLDFWTVKNVTGRIMVGLRWWNYIDDEGKSIWVFEARNGDSQKQLSTTEIRIFWASLIATPIMWTLFLFTALFGLKLKWMVLVFIGLTLSLSNLMGYLRCKMGKTDSVSSVMSGVANQYLQKRMMENMMGMLKPKPAAPATGSTNLPA